MTTPMRRLRLVVATVLAVAALAACANPAQVPWRNYSPSLQAVIDSAAAQKDCPTLQGLLDLAVTTNSAQRQSTGTGNQALIAYIEDAQKAAGCR